MESTNKIWRWVVPAIAVGALLIVFLVLRLRHQSITIQGAVVIGDTDPRKELPVADVEVMAAKGAADAPTRSDASGLFSLKLRKWVRKGQPLTLRFHHAGYEPLELTEVAGDKLYVARLVPIEKKADHGPKTVIGNVRVRYSVKATRTLNVGSAVKTFEVKNTANVPCRNQAPCSPDGKWKAAIGSVSLDAGLGNEFRNVRVSCFAGPCPFTKIESEDFSKPSQTITASARAWSDTATFLVEAEVVHVMQSDIDHESYPVIFGPALTFTLPSEAEGVSLEADVSGETIIFPLGPDLFLTWANCSTRPDQDKGNIYRCELKPGYEFR
jgi:hypothetical protein